MRKSDPFKVDPLPKAFYYPSREKELSKKEKKVCLSAPHISKDTEHQVSSPEDLKFLKETNTLKAQEVPTRENGSTADLSSTSQFNESWPSTERTGSLGTPQSDGTVSSLEMSQQMREWLEGQEKPVTNTTLGWYINRFRNAPPTDRQQRDKAALTNRNKADFWWLSPTSGPSTPSGQSTPLPVNTPPQRLLPSPKKSPSPTSKKRGKPTSSLSSPSSIQIHDKTTADLERRAAELLGRSETSVETISTEPFPLPLKKLGEDKTVPAKAGFGTLDKSPHKTKTSIVDKSTSTRPQNPWPEDDILYQWRLARKMEKAQERATGIDVRVPVKKTELYDIRTPMDLHQRTHLQQYTIPEPISSLSTFDSALPGPSGLSMIPGQTIPALTPILSTSMGIPLVTTVSTTASNNMVYTTRGSSPVSIATCCVTSTRPIMTPVISKPCRHLETNTSEAGVGICDTALQPHMHLACDILPCHCTGDTTTYSHHHNHHHHQHEKSHRMDEYRLPTKNLLDNMRKDDVKYQTDNEKENEIPACKKSSVRPDLCKKASEFSKHRSQEEIKTSSSWESLSSGTESEKETERPREKGKQHYLDKKEKRKEDKTAEMVKNVIGEVISEHMFSGQPSTNNSDEKDTEGETSGIDVKEQKEAIFTIDLESSEEEFPDDEILKILRQRSRDLKKELRRIDSLLEQES